MNKLLVITALGLFLAVHFAVALLIVCPSGCGAVRVARSARYEAGCSLAAALAPTALARAWQRTTGSLDRLPQMRVVAEPSAQLLLRLIPLQSAPLAVSGCSAAPNRRGAVPQQGRASQQHGPALGAYRKCYPLIKADVPQRVTRVPEVDEYKPAYCHAHVLSLGVAEGGYCFRSCAVSRLSLKSISSRREHDSKPVCTRRLQVHE